MVSAMNYWYVPSNPGVQTPYVVLQRMPTHKYLRGEQQTMVFETPVFDAIPITVTSYG